jgi:hypothetical protein
VKVSIENYADQKLLVLAKFNNNKYLSSCNINFDKRVYIYKDSYIEVYDLLGSGSQKWDSCVFDFSTSSQNTITHFMVIDESELSTIISKIQG